MNRAVRIISTLGFAACTMLLLVRQSSGQTTLPANWNLPPLDCTTSTQTCEIRLSLEGDLFILYHSANGPQLYVSQHDEENYRVYSLNPRWVTGAAVEFVPFSIQNVVVFYTSLALGTLSRLDLITGEMSLLPQNSDIARVLPCNSHSARIGSQGYISRLGTGNLLLMCSLDSAALDTLVSVVDVVAQTTLFTVDFGVGWSGEGTGRPWDYLLGGQDGNIYIQTRFGSNWDISQQLIDSLPDLPDWGLRIFRYEVFTGTWFVRNIYPEQMASPNYPPTGSVINARIVAIMSNGDIVYRFDWRTQDGGESSEISRYDANFNLVERISSQTLGRAARFVGISADGLVLLQSGSNLADLYTFQISIAPPTAAPIDNKNAPRAARRFVIDWGSIKW